MLRWSRSANDDEGSAALEFIVVGVILLVPLVYLVVALGVIQEQTLGVEAAARHTARVIGMAEDADDAAARSDTVLADVVDEYGIDPGTVRVSLSCTPVAAPCPAPGATVIVSVTATVRLPLVPPILGLDELASLPVQADAAQKVSRLWGAG